MIYKGDNPVGIDVHVQHLQKELHEYLLEKWGIDEKQYDCYGIAYRNNSAIGYIPEYYQGSNEYVDTLYNDQMPVTSFFGIGKSDNIVKNDFVTDVHIVFFVNLEVIKPNITHRGDVEVRTDVFNCLNQQLFGFELNRCVRDVSEVLAEYPGKAKDNLIKTLDIHPNHTFRYNMTCTYDPNSIIN